MEWDQKLFHFFWNASRSAFRRASPVPRARLNQQTGRWSLFAGLLAGRSIQVVENEGEAVFEKTADQFWLPLTAPLFGDEREDQDFLRCCLLLLSKSLSANQNNLAPLARWRAIFAEYPAARDLYRRVATAIRRSEAEDARLSAGRRRRLRRHLRAAMRSSTSMDVVGAGDDPETLSEAESPLAQNRRDESGEKRRIELQAQQELLRVDRKQIEEYTLGHNFEKIETADEFDGRWRDLENDEHPDETAEALEEVKLGYRIRTPDAPGAIRDADVGSVDAPEAASADTTEAPVYFDEWDDRRKQYRRNHCRVFIREFREQRPGFAHRAMAAERRTFLRIDRRLQECFQELETVRRQTGGDEPDYEAVVAALADLRAGRTPDERLYMGRRKRRKNISLHFLLDLSLSTDAFVAGRRVLEVERTALTIFGEVLERHACRFAVSAFYSRTRNDCVYLNIKKASASWAATRDRLGALTARGYTRIGPAIRRTIDEFRELRDGSRSRWVVLFTDGRPNDYDRYEGRYGIRDVRQAVREAEAAGIQLQAFAIGVRAAPTLQEMFGRDRFEVIREPADLAGALGEFFLRLIR